MRTFAMTKTGFVRRKNEDRYLIKKMDDDSVFLAVADGMGGAVAGEVAAEIAIGRLEEIRSGAVDFADQLNLLTEQADRDILLEVKKNSDLEGMGTTLTGVLLNNGAGYWIHVGDSRLYHIRGNQLIWQTKDQSFVQSLLDEGTITEREAVNHPVRNLIDQCVGCGDCEPEKGHLNILSGDLIMLSTDGLHDAVDEATIVELLSLDADIEIKANELVNRALDAGGKDNITVVLAQL